MTKEELLNPRYKVLCKYPFSPYDVGDIIELTDGEVQFIAAETSQYVHMQPCTLLEELPNIYQPLQWWEDRKPEDMPSFVKHKETGQVWRVNQISEFSPMFTGISGTNYIWMHLSKTLPGTEEEYNEYINQQP